MSSTRRRLALIAAPAALLVGLASAPSAGAVVYCVPDTSIDASCEMPAATIQAGLTSAASTGAADTVRIGPGLFPTPPVAYDESVGGTLQLIGSGRSATTWQSANSAGPTTAFSLQNTSGNGSSISDLSFTLVDDADAVTDTGIVLSGGTMSRVDLTGASSDNTQGINVFGSPVIDDSTVTLQQPSMSGNQAITGGGNPTITDSTISAETGFSRSGTGQTAVIRRTTFHSSLFAVAADSGTIDISDSLIDLMGTTGARGITPSNFNPGIDPISAIVDGVTIVNGGANSRGIWASADSGPDDMVNNGETSTATVSNTVISGVELPIIAEADRGEVATVTVSYSNYDPAGNVEDDDISNGGATGNATLTETNTTNLAPGFVNPAMGDYHLLPTSPLLDIGDPVAPAPGALDIDGDARALDATFDCNFVQRRDIGADEYSGATQGMPTSCNPPMTPATPTTPTQSTPVPAKPCTKKKKKKKPRALAACKKKKKKKRR